MTHRYKPNALTGLKMVTGKELIEGWPKWFPGMSYIPLQLSAKITYAAPPPTPEQAKALAKAQNAVISSWNNYFAVLSDTIGEKT